MKTYLESKNAEDDNACENRCTTVDCGNHDSISKHVVVDWVIARHCDQSAESQAERVEDLCRCFKPYFRFTQVLELQGKRHFCNPYTQIAMAVMETLLPYRGLEPGA